MSFLRKIANFFGEIIRNVIVGITVYVTSLLVTLFVGVFLIFLLWVVIKFYNWYVG
ncbi:hypothetical protein [Flavobacterium sp.]|uniref:hypothetical protein n=1 Tax=Flavobacterium sp. TaxID=239 RepID=UPI0025C27DA7|nr:hypothetical protein [Flavobacterium sp.]